MWKQNRPGGGLPADRRRCAFSVRAFPYSLTPSLTLPKAPSPPRKLLNQSSEAEVPRLLCQVPPPPTSLVFARTPSSSRALLRWLPTPPPAPSPHPPNSILAQLGSQCGAWAPDRDSAARATLQGPLSALQGAAPLANRGQCVCVVCVCGGGGLARPGCDRARAGECPRELRWGCPLWQGRGPLPRLVKQAGCGQ